VRISHTTTLPDVHASTCGGDESPALAWVGATDGTAQLLLVVEDPDAPTARPGVRPPRSTVGRGYRGPAPVRGLGPHRYVFQIFALAEPLTTINGKPRGAAKPRGVLAGAKAHARSRSDGFCERT
jgi:phosphatidylethanolamine-binding protein (PEBP) family uncharacterized protein